MVAGWVQNDLDFVKWVGANVDAAGAYWCNAPSYFIGPVDIGGIGETTAVIFDASNWVTFHADQSRLKIEFTAYSSPAGWEYTEYSYQYDKPPKMIFRYDKHDDPKFERKHGTDCHVHVGNDHKRHRLPTGVTELDGVLERVWEHQQTGIFTF